MISPGPCAPAEAGISIEAVRSCAAAGTPLLGICLGHQAIAAAFGAAIIRAPRPVHGQAFDVAHDGRGVFAGLPALFRATRYHSLIIDEPTLPPDLVITARTGALPMGVRHAAAPVEGVQFHPESILTPHGRSAHSQLREINGPFDIKNLFPRTVPGPTARRHPTQVPGGPARIVGAYSSSWLRPSKVRLLIRSSATSG